MDHLCNTIATVIVKDWIRPLVANLNSSFITSGEPITEEYIIKVLSDAEDVKHMPKSKRVLKHSSSSLFQVRSYEGYLELVKLKSNKRLYLHDKSLVVYVVSKPSSEYSSAVSSSSKSDDAQAGCPPKGLENPESELGYMFPGKVTAVGSLVDNRMEPLTASDEELCGALGICTKIAGKISRSMKQGEIDTSQAKHVKRQSPEQDDECVHLKKACTTSIR